MNRDTIIFSTIHSVLKKESYGNNNKLLLKHFIVILRLQVPICIFSTRVIHTTKHHLAKQTLLKNCQWSSLRTPTSASRCAQTAQAHSAPPHTPDSFSREIECYK